MAIVSKGRHLGARLRAGDTVLAAAKTIDTKRVAPQLRAFEAAHAELTTVQQAAEALKTRRLELPARINEAGLDQRMALDALARAMIADGADIQNPFANLDSPTLRTLLSMRPAAAAQALRGLLPQLQRVDTLSDASRAALQTLERALAAVEELRNRKDEIARAENSANQTGTAIGHRWSSTFDALKHACRLAASEGTPQLLNVLFHSAAKPTATRSRNKANAAAGTPAAMPAIETER